MSNICCIMCDGDKVKLIGNCRIDTWLTRLKEGWYDDESTSVNNQPMKDGYRYTHVIYHHIQCFSDLRSPIPDPTDIKSLHSLDVQHANRDTKTALSHYYCPRVFDIWYLISNRNIFPPYIYPFYELVNPTVFNMNTWWNNQLDCHPYVSYQPPSSDEQNIMPPRRSHKKSKAGCQRCKQRKIKVPSYIQWYQETDMDMY